MIDVAPLLKIMPLFFICLIVPGPDFFVVSSLSMSRGCAAGLLATLAIAVGDTMYATASMLGLSAIFANWQWLAVVVRVAGGMYLLYIGAQLWRASFRRTIAGDKIAVRTGRQRNPFFSGLLTNLTNPKAMAFFSSIFAVVLPSHASAPTQYALVFMITGMTLTWFGFVSLVLTAPAMRKVYLRWSRWIDRVAGTLMGLFGLRLLVSGRN